MEGVGLVLADGRARGDAGDFVDFHVAGTPGEGEYHCAECGYGVTIYRTLPTCPMCGNEVWEQTAWRSLTVEYA